MNEDRSGFGPIPISLKEAMGKLPGRRPNPLSAYGFAPRFDANTLGADLGWASFLPIVIEDDAGSFRNWRPSQNVEVRRVPDLEIPADLEDNEFRRRQFQRQLDTGVLEPLPDRNAPFQDTGISFPEMTAGLLGDVRLRRKPRR